MSDPTYLNCTCFDLRHVLQFNILEGEGLDPELWVSTIPDTSVGFWERVKMALQFVFRNNPWTASETFLDLEEAEKLHDLIHQFERRSHG